MANRNCSGSDGPGYKTLANGLAATTAAGDILYIRSGTYTEFTGGQRNLTGGSSGNPITYQGGYSGVIERPIFDGTGNTNSGHAMFGISGTSNITMKHMELRNNRAAGIRISGASSNINLENIYIHDVGMPDNYCAFQLGGSGNNIAVLNCDAYSIGGSTGTGTDGFSFSDATGSGLSFTNCRAWRCSDDGYCLWQTAPGVTIIGCWSWENGYDASGTRTSGNGDGFKLGGQTTAGGHTVKNCLAWGNAAAGFDQNEGTGTKNGDTIYNCTGWQNGVPQFNFDSATAPHVIRNCVCDTDQTNNMDGGGATHDHNSWDSGKTVNSSDFLTTSFTANTGSRKADGSLPDSNFLHLVSGSDLIDAGVDVGLPYSGSAPDMGAYEFTPTGGLAINVSLSDSLIYG